MHYQGQSLHNWKIGGYDLYDSLKHQTATSTFSVQLVKMSAVSYSAIVLAVHDISSNPGKLYVVLAPKKALNDVKARWNVVDEIRRFPAPLISDERIHFCVPLSDDNHLPLKYHTLR